MRGNTARLVATLGVWFAVAFIFTGGVFYRRDWAGVVAQVVLVVIVLGVTAGAVAATAFIWRNPDHDEAPDHR